MTRVAIRDVVCIDETAMASGERPANALLVDADSFPMELWVLRAHVASDSEVKRRGDHGVLILEHHEFHSPEERRRRMDQALADRARQLRGEQVRAETAAREADRARQRAEEARAARAKAQAQSAQRDLKPDNLSQDEDDPAVQRFRKLDLDDRHVDEPSEAREPTIRDSASREPAPTSPGTDASGGERAPKTSASGESAPEPALAISPSPHDRAAALLARDRAIRATFEHETLLSPEDYRAMLSGSKSPIQVLVEMNRRREGRPEDNLIEALTKRKP